MISVDNKYEIGTEVFSIWKKPVKNKCSLCEGKGFITHKEVDIKCPQCKGAGDIENKDYTCWEVMNTNLKISSVKATINGAGIKIRYSLNGYKRAEENVFLTKEEAQKRCNELNCALQDN